MNGNILILNENPEGRAHLDKLCSQVATVYACSNFKTAGDVLKSQNVNVIILWPVTYHLMHYSIRQ